jgi:hypothetical protein
MYQDIWLIILTLFVAMNFTLNLTRPSTTNFDFLSKRIGFRAKEIEGLDKRLDILVKKLGYAWKPISSRWVLKKRRKK